MRWIHLRSTLVLWTFLLLWLAAGAGVGFLISHHFGPIIGATVAAMAAVGCLVYALSSGKELVLSMAGAHVIQAGEQPELHHIVRELAGRAGLPAPVLYLIDDPSPNAFATGRSPRDAVIAVTSGLLQEMNEAELEGVIAHELSHIRNRDVRLLLIVTAGIGLAGLLASWAWNALARMRGTDSEDERVRGILVGATLLLGLIGWFLGPLLQLGLSRTRESLADAAGVALVGSPTGLLAALDKLRANAVPVRKVNHLTAAMYIDNPLEHGHVFAHLFDTHPPIGTRIAALERMAGLPASLVSAGEATVSESPTSTQDVTTAPGEVGSQKVSSERQASSISERSDAIGTMIGLILLLPSFVVFVLWPGLWWSIILGILVFFGGYGFGYHVARNLKPLRVPTGLAAGTVFAAGEIALLETGLWLWGLVASAVVVTIVLLEDGLMSRRRMSREVDRYVDLQRRVR